MFTLSKKLIGLNKKQPIHRRQTGIREEMLARLNKFNQTLRAKIDASERDDEVGKKMNNKDIAELQAYKAHRKEIDSKHMTSTKGLLRLPSCTCTSRRADLFIYSQGNECVGTTESPMFSLGEWAQIIFLASLRMETLRPQGMGWLLLLREVAKKPFSERNDDRM